MIDIEVIQAWSYIPLQGCLIVAVVILWREMQRMKKRQDDMFDKMFMVVLSDNISPEGDGVTGNVGNM